MRFRAAFFIAVVFASVAVADQRTAPRFRADDPLMADNDRAVDVGKLPERDDSDIYDFVESTFMSPGSSGDIRTLNVNTIDEVPDSSWFANRRGPLPSADVLARGPDTLPALDITGWPVAEGKGEGATPGFRLKGPDGALYQLKFDPVSNPEMATAAEVIGTAFYHAFGYHVVEQYLVEFDGASYTLTPDAKISLQGGKERPLTRKHVDAVLALAARSPNGRYRAVARRYPPNADVIGSFRYHGTRSDDPNDIFPHEHRRELRGARVFAAWLNHDDARGINSKDILVTEGGKRYVKHFMYDFNSILGSGTYQAQKYRSGNEYQLDTDEAFKTLLTFGLYVRPWAKYDYPDVPPAVGRFEGQHFDPVKWRPNYPIPAFQNMRDDDAFWAARIVARFDEPAVRAIVGKGRYTDPAAADVIVRTLMERREKILRVWLNGVMPVVDPVLDGSGLAFRNASVDAGAASAPASYQVTWYAFDNNAGTHRRVGETASAAAGARIALPSQLANEPFVMAAISADGGPAGWRKPARVYFKRESGGWKLVGLERHHAVLPNS